MKYILFSLGLLLTLSCNLKVDKKNEISDFLNTVIPTSHELISYHVSNNKLITLSESKSNINVSFYENLSKSWTKLNSIDFEDDSYSGISYSAFDTIKYITIDNHNYFLTKLLCMNKAAVTAGLLHYRYVLYNINLDLFEVIDYRIWENQLLGSYEVKDKKLSEFKNIISYLNENEIYMNDIDLTDPSNYYLKWYNVNRGIYDNIERREVWHDINFIEINRNEFYDFYEQNSHLNMYRNGSHIAISGFKSPIYVFNKYEKKGYLIWVPQGYPNGSAWGARSFYIKRISENGVVELDNEYVEYIVIDTKNKKVQSLPIYDKYKIENWQ